MWQRFTERARVVVFRAQEEAQVYGQRYVSTEHLMLGLLKSRGSVALRALQDLGIDSQQVEAAIRQLMPHESGEPSQDMTLTISARRLIDNAYQEANALQNNYIGTEHLLLGVLQEEESQASKVLREHGLMLDDLRNVIRSIQEKDPRPGSEVTVKNNSFGYVMAGLRHLLTYGSRPEGLALMLLADDKGEVDVFLKRLQSSRVDLHSRLEAKYVARSDSPSALGQMTSIFKLAGEDAQMSGLDLGTAHILIALFRDGDNEVARYFSERGTTLQQMRDALAAEG